MATYTYTIPANTKNGNNKRLDTGIQLSPTEYVVSMDVSPMSSIQAKTLTLPTTYSFGFSLYAYLENENSQVIGHAPGYFSYPNVSSLSYFFAYNSQVANNTTYTVQNTSGAESTSYNENYSKGAHIYFKLMGYGNPSSKSASHGFNDETVQLLTPVTFTIETYKTPPTVTTSVIPSGSGTVSSTSVSDYEKTVTATANNGYKFVQWSTTGGYFADYLSPSTTLYLPNDVASVTVTAAFTQTSSVTSAGRYSGTAWNKVIPLRYDGTNWVECELQRYNGTSWDNVDTQ